MPNFPVPPFQTGPTPSCAGSTELETPMPATFSCWDRRARLPATRSAVYTPALLPRASSGDRRAAGASLGVDQPLATSPAIFESLTVAERY
jgi:hypothetical protein